MSEILRVLKWTSKGIQDTRHVGEIFEFKDEKWVIIKILKVRVIYPSSPSLITHFIGQKINSNIDYSQYSLDTTITEEIKSADWFGTEKIKSVGTAFDVSDEKEEVFGVAIVESVESMRFDTHNLKIKYVISLVQPWDKKRIDKIIQENRRATFKLIRSD